MCSETVAEGISAWQAGQAAARGRGDDQEVRRARCDASKWTARREGNSRGLEAVEGCWLRGKAPWEPRSFTELRGALNDE